jgi:hypothetical protein
VARSGRSLVTLLGVALAVAGLAACAGSEEVTSPSAPAPSAPAAASPPAAPTPTPAPATAAEPFTPPPAVEATLREYIRTTVLRTDLARSWELTAPELRVGYTREKWLTGSIPVVPFARDDYGDAQIRVIEAEPHDVFLSVLVRPRAGSSALPVEYFAHVVPVEDTWLVSYLAPSGRQAGIPGHN